MRSWSGPDRPGWRREQCSGGTASTPSSSNGPVRSVTAGGGTTTGCTSTRSGLSRTCQGSGSPGRRAVGLAGRRGPVPRQVRPPSSARDPERHRGSTDRAVGRSMDPAHLLADARGRARGGRHGFQPEAPSPGTGREGTRSPASSSTPASTGTQSRTDVRTSWSSARATPAPRSRSTSWMAERQARPWPCGPARTSFPGW